MVKLIAAVSIQTKCKTNKKKIKKYKWNAFVNKLKKIKLQCAQKKKNKKYTLHIKILKAKTQRVE